MKRYSLIQARGAEFSCGTEGMALEDEGNDVIELNVKSGTLCLIVPSTLPDRQVGDACFTQHSCLELELEDGTHISGWVRGGEAHLEAEFGSRRPIRTRVAPTHHLSKRSQVRHTLLTKSMPVE